MKFGFYEEIDGKRRRIQVECVSWGEIAKDVATARASRFTERFRSIQNEIVKKLMSPVWLDLLSGVDLYLVQPPHDLQSTTRGILYSMSRFQDWTPEAVQKAPEGVPDSDSDLWRQIAEVEPIDVPEEFRRRFYEGITVRLDQLQEWAPHGPVFLQAWLETRCGLTIPSRIKAARAWEHERAEAAEVSGEKLDRRHELKQMRQRFPGLKAHEAETVWGEIPVHVKRKGRPPKKTSSESPQH